MEAINHMRKGISYFKLRESDILRQVRDYLRYHGWFVIRIHQSLGSYPGISDLIAVKDGRVVFVEVKTPKGRLSEAQVRFKEEIEAHGGSFLVIRSLEEIMEKFNNS